MEPWPLRVGNFGTWLPYLVEHFGNLIATLRGSAEELMNQLFYYAGTESRFRPARRSRASVRHRPRRVLQNVFS